jgi:hypothetical protein
LGSLVVCPHCQTRVLPMAERRCPACRKNVDTTPDEPTPEQVAEAAYDVAAEQILRGGNPSEIQASLTQRGMDTQAAATVVAQLKQERAQARKVAAQQNMFYGAFWCIGGIAVTVTTFQFAAGMGGGTFIIAWGAILFGAIQFLRGLIQFGGE